METSTLTDGPVMVAVPPFGTTAAMDAYMSLINATERAFDAGERAITAKLAYETAKTNGLANGAVTGSNCEQREACAQNLYRGLYQEMREAEAAERDAKKDLRLAELQVERLKLELRLAELMGRSGLVEY